MSMIEKFLENKSALHKNLDELREEALKVVAHKADVLVDEFIDGVKAMVAEASDEEFVAFITSGKLDDEDIVAAIAFRAEANNGAKESDKPNEKHGRHVNVFVLN